MRTPIFPLPETVFFPDTVLPLHLFEPRYRQMGRDVIEGEGELVVVLLKPGWEHSYEGNPPVHEIATLGVLEDHDELSDGRINIVLRGATRVRLLSPGEDELLPGKLYRTRRYEPAPERHAARTESAAIAARIRERGLELFEKSGHGDWTLPGSDALAALVNQLAHVIDIPPRLKQTLLEDDDLLARASRLEAYMDEQLKFWRALSSFRSLKPDDPSVN